MQNLKISRFITLLILIISCTCLFAKENNENDNSVVIIDNYSNLFLLSFDNYFFTNSTSADIILKDELSFSAGIHILKRSLTFDLPDVPIANINKKYNYKETDEIYATIGLNYDDHIVVSYDSGPEGLMAFDYKGMFHPNIRPLLSAGVDTLVSGESDIYDATFEHNFDYSYYHYGINVQLFNIEAELYTGAEKIQPNRSDAINNIQFFGSFETSTKWGAMLSYAFSPDILLDWSGAIHISQGKMSAYLGSTQFLSIETDDFRFLNNTIHLSLFYLNLNYTQNIITVRNGRFETNSAPVSPVGSIYRIDNYFESIAADMYIHHASAEYNYQTKAFSINSLLDFYVISLNYALIYSRMEGSIVTSPVILDEQRAFNKSSQLLRLELIPSWTVDQFTFGCSINQIIPLSIQLPEEITEFLPSDNISLLGFNASLWVTYSSR